MRIKSRATNAKNKILTSNHYYRFLPCTSPVIHAGFKSPCFSTGEPRRLNIANQLPCGLLKWVLSPMS